MTSGDTDIILVLRKNLAERIGLDRYELWFGTGVRMSLRDQTLEVAAPDQFLLDRIRKGFTRDLQIVAADIVGAEFQLAFDVDTTLRGSPSSDQATTVTCTPSIPLETKQRRRKYASIDELIVGSCNRIAVAAAQSVKERLGRVSPLFVYGPSGTGKTHLLEGIWSSVDSRQKVMVSAEQFTTYFLSALRGTGLPSFRRKYRGVQLLVIDDVQFFAGKQATVVELQHTIDTLINDGRQIVIAADRPPAQLKGFGPEIIARLTGGLVCEMEVADLETRQGILQRFAKQMSLRISRDVVQLIANRFPGDARQLRGAVHRLQATSEAFDKAITCDMAEDTLRDLIQSVQPMVRIPDIDQAVCEVFGLDGKSLQSKRKSKSISQPRMLAMWLARKYTRAAYSEIGSYFGHRSHSTVIAAQHKVDHWMANHQEIEVSQGPCRIEEALRQIEVQLRTG